jgi:hypothetical protein
LATWVEFPESKKGLQAERALTRYFMRMTGRSTPFGLFSGCSVGTMQRQWPAGETRDLEEIEAFTSMVLCMRLLVPKQLFSTARVMSRRKIKPLKTKRIENLATAK